MDAVRNAISQGKIPSAVVIATSTNGKININESLGVKNAAGDPRTADTVCRMASCTKLLTAVSIMQAVERGLLDLDAPIKNVIPEIADLHILTGYDDAGSPIMHPPQTDITLTHLLTHSSGLGYTFSSPLLQRWCAENGKEVTRSARTFADNYSYPLLFEPGTQWLYGSGLDWAARALERAAHTTLDAWVQAHICAPLGAAVTFFPQRRPELLAARGDNAARTPAGGFEFGERHWWQRDAIDCFGGSGAFASPASFFKVLNSLLRDDGALLSPASRARLFAPALTPAAERSCFERGVQLGRLSVHGLVPAQHRKSYALGGLVGLDDETARDGTRAYRRALSVSWSGMPNHYWTVDPAAGLAVYTSFHFEPWGDETCVGLGRDVEEEIYAML